MRPAKQLVDALWDCPTEPTRADDLAEDAQSSSEAEEEGRWRGRWRLAPAGRARDGIEHCLEGQATSDNGAPYGAHARAPMPSL